LSRVSEPALDIDALLAEALEKRRALGLPNEHTNAYRLVHAEGDGLPGLTVDVYDQHLVASLYTEDRGEREDAWLAALARLPFRGVYLKQRPRQANELDEAERRERAPERAVLGESAAPAFEVRENGVPLEVRLGEGLSTGLFLDQRDNRARLMQLAPGKSVLNLFAYSCAFGAVAAASGARRTVNIDVSKPALERGRRNYQLNGIELSEHLFWARDVFETLPKLAKREERFDIVVLDPPSYASTRRGRFSVERDYPDLAEIAMRLLTEGGTLLACLNHHKLDERALRDAVSAAGNSASMHIRELEFVPPPADHEPLRGRVPHLKSAWIRF
jgi:23S rRNA (cytosine1962-C5)-methyltransferase